MARMKIAQLTPAMELGADVADLNNQPLLAAGTVLSEGDIRLLKTWGVVEVEIGGEDVTPVDPLAALSPSEREHIDREMSRLFRFAPTEHPVIAALYRESLERYVNTRRASQDAT